MLSRVVHGEFLISNQVVHSEFLEMSSMAMLISEESCFVTPHNVSYLRFLIVWSFKCSLLRQGNKLLRRTSQSREERNLFIYEKLLRSVSYSNPHTSHLSRRKLQPFHKALNAFRHSRTLLFWSFYTGSSPFLIHISVTAHR